MFMVELRLLALAQSNMELHTNPFKADRSLCDSFFGVDSMSMLVLGSVGSSLKGSSSQDLNPV